MVEPKVRLSLVVPGATMLSSQECDKNPECYDTHKMLIETEKGKGKNKKRVTELLIVKTRKSKPAKQSISICKESYEYMISASEIPSAKYAKKDEKGKTLWSKMTIEERLNVHMQEIAEALGALEFSYEVLED